MPRSRAFSAQTLAVIAALARRPSSWRHGYDLAAETGLQSGTLYPILIRLADKQLVEACWEEAQPAGRPRRHLYRLTGEGLAVASATLGELAEQPARVIRPAPRRVAAPRRLAGEGS